jgi:hypothetical protein
MVQTVFVLISVVCIPVMLFTKPIILLRRHQNQQKVTKSNQNSKCLRFKNEILLTLKQGNRLRDFGHVNPAADVGTSSQSVHIEHDEHEKEVINSMQYSFFESSNL